MPSERSAIAPARSDFGFATLAASASVTALSVLPLAARKRLGAGLAPLAAGKTGRAAPRQSLFSPCCHLRRCSPNQEINIAASRNGIIAVAMADPSPG